MENKTYIIPLSFILICDQGVSIAMSNNTDVQSITNVSNTLKETTVRLKNITSSLQSKLNNYMKC